MTNLNYAILDLDLGDVFTPAEGHWTRSQAEAVLATWDLGRDCVILTESVALAAQRFLNNL